MQSEVEVAVQSEVEVAMQTGDRITPQAPATLAPSSPVEGDETRSPETPCGPLCFPPMGRQAGGAEAGDGLLEEVAITLGSGGSDCTQGGRISSEHLEGEWQ